MENCRMASSSVNWRIFEFFKAGRHTAMNGSVLEFSEAELERICRNYPFQTPAPLVIGHPPSNGPAYGTVREIFHKAGSLYAVADCGAALVDMVRAGRFKNRSASFFKTADIPGFQLRHIGFLGAAAPAVLGLDKLQFSSSIDSDEVLCFSDSALIGEAPTAGAFGLTIPAGYRIEPQMAHRYNRACQVQASCPDLSFAEAVSLADRYYP